MNNKEKNIDPNLVGNQLRVLRQNIFEFGHFKICVFMIIKYFICWCILLLLYIITGCNNSSKDCDQLPHFDLTELTQASEVKLSELGVFDIQYIPLETDSSNLISRIKKNRNRQ